MKILKKCVRVPIARPDLGYIERENVEECMISGWITQGQMVAKAEGMLCRFTGRKHAICTSSGTTALIIALMAIDPGWRPWKVSAPALTFAAVHNAIRLLGGTVILEGADMNSWQVPYREMDVSADASIVAPCYGKMEGLGDVWAATRGMVIEDACESFTGLLNGRPAGTFGTISVVSFYANKICTSGEGGALLTDSESLALRLRAIANQGIVGKSYMSVVRGLNGRMTDMQAAILCGQLDRMPKMLDRRRKIEAAYESAARGKWKLRTTSEGEVCAPWLFAAIPDDVVAVWKRCEVENIECRPFFPISAPVVDMGNPLMHNALELSRQGIVLPLSSALTDDEVNRVVEVING